jgi:polyphosphate kinase
MQTSLIRTLRLFKHAQSAKLPLPKRLRALGLMAQGIDQALTFTPAVGAAGLQSIDSVAAQVAGLNLAQLLEEATQLVHGQLLPRVQRYRVQIAAIEQLSEAQRSWLWHYFQQQIYPLLTPFAVDSGRPFPFIQTTRLNFLVVLQSTLAKPRETERYGLVQIPSRLPRLIQAEPCLPAQPESNTAMRCLVWREEIVRHFLPFLFSGMNVKAVYQFRLLRAPRNHDPASLTAAEQHPRMAQGPITQLDVEKTMPTHLRHWLTSRLQIRGDQVLACPPPLGLADLCELADMLTGQ